MYETGSRTSAILKDSFFFLICIFKKEEEAYVNISNSTSLQCFREHYVMASLISNKRNSPAVSQANK